MEDLLRGQTSIRVLKTLLRHPARDFTGRELAREANANPSESLRVLDRLRLHGVVQRRTVGRAHLWEVNRKHWMVGPLKQLLAVDDGALRSLQAVIADQFRQLPGIRRIVLFGSVARGDERPNSDIDLLVIVDSVGRKGAIEGTMRLLRERIDRTFTNPLREVIYSRPEYDRKRQSPLVRNIERDGIVLLDLTKDEDRKAGPREG
ncbi:MAG: nucleotidyltransferase domain-containing protein [Euryarchaeota archaeon]|nr:nucleotidyltransferase domain-containing protein [Euryarchaeota archaeon]